MTVDFGKFCEWEQDKANYLVKIARQLGMDVSGYGMLDVNPNSGYTYLWLEDYPFTLYMPIGCELQESDVWVLRTNPEDGEEAEKTLDEFTGLDSIYEWVKTLEEDLDDEE